VIKQAAQIVILAGMPTALMALEVTDRFEVSGFARVVTGYLDHSEQSYEGYEDSVAVDQQTLLALQPSFSVSPQLSVTGQLLAHSSDQRKSGVEWAYLAYRPSNAWQFRVGKLRMPFFRYSDGIDVGYTYAWISAPAQVYNNYLFSTFNGGSASYQHAWPQLALTVEGYYGNFDGDIYIAGSRVDVDAKVNDLRGVVLNLRRQNTSLRVSYHQGDNITDLPELDALSQGLAQAGFQRSANSLDSRGNINVLQTALSYESLRYFAEAEWVQTSTEFALTPELTGYYLMAGMYFGEFSVHATYAASAYGDIEAESELRPLLAQPANPIYPLAAGYYQLLERIPDGSLDSYKIGTRWDFRLNMALKAEVAWLQETSPRSGFFSTSEEGLYDPDYDADEHSAILYQLGWEWIF
jgi:hypothetical protein